MKRLVLIVAIVALFPINGFAQVPDKHKWNIVGVQGQVFLVDAGQPT